MFATLYDNRVISALTNLDEDPITGNYPVLAREVRSLLGWYGNGQRMTSRVAARKTGISHTTISGLLQGDRFRMELMIQFARGMGLDTAGVNRILRAADYPEIADEKPERALAHDYMQRRGGVDDLKTTFTDQELEQLRKGADMVVAKWLAEIRREQNKDQ
jgi:hypothetical protein